MTPGELGPLEMRVLGLLEAEPEQSVAAIQQRLEGQGDAFAYTTVMTVLRRLHGKGLVSRRKQARRHLYRVSGKAPGVKRGLLNRVRRALFQQDRAQPIVALLEDEELSIDELHELRRLIDDKLAERGS